MKSDYRGVKSFTEYAERISYQKQLMIGKEISEISSFIAESQTPFKSCDKKRPVLISHETPSMLMQDDRRSNLTHYTPQTDTLIKSKALQIMTNT